VNNGSANCKTRQEHCSLTTTVILILSPSKKHHSTAASFVTPFLFWNDVSIFCNSEVISTSGSAALLTLT